MVNAIAEYHAGTVELSSRLLAGSTFTVRTTTGGIAHEPDSDRRG
ncbi:hypothetical protein WKK05_22685 [Nostoc sp. UHCC 0302]